MLATALPTAKAHAPGKIEMGGLLDGRLLVLSFMVQSAFPQQGDLVSPPLISVCVPAYNAGRFLRETLDSILRQTFQNFELLISVDRGEDESWEVAAEFCFENTGRSCECFRQEQRLGWVDNVNFLLHKAAAQLLCVMPHDDLPHPTYLETLVATLAANPQASQVYCDIEAFGDVSEFLLIQESIRGSKFERVLDFLQQHFNAVAFRGLLRRSKAGPLLPLRHNEIQDFAADTLWNLQLILCGELIRVPLPLYRKRFHRDSAHRSWSHWEDQQQEQAWLTHCRNCLEVLREQGFSLEEWHLIVHETRLRLLQERVDFYSPQLFRGLAPERKRRLLDLLGPAEDYYAAPKSADFKNWK